MSQRSDRDLAAALYGVASLVVRQMPRDVSLTAVSVLHALERLGPQRLTRLAGLQGVSQPSATALVSRLEHDGLVERRPDENDRRVVLVALTATGRRFVAARRETGAGVVADLLARLPAKETRRLRHAEDALSVLGALEPFDVAPAATHLVAR